MNKVLREMVGLNVLQNKLIKQATLRIHETFYANEKSFSRAFHSENFKREN